MIPSNTVKLKRTPEEIFKEAYQGYEEGHGFFLGYKPDGKKDAEWRRQKPNIEEHIKGNQIIGLSPYNMSKGGCRWFGIDIDSEIEAKEICNYLFLLDPQIFPFKSHNGRWHIYKYYDEFLPIEIIYKDIDKITKDIKKNKSKWIVDHTVPSRNSGKPNGKFPEGAPGHWLFIPYQSIPNKEGKTTPGAKCYSPKGTPLDFKQYTYRLTVKQHPLLSSSVGLMEDEKRHKALFNCALYLQQNPEINVTLKDVDNNFTDPVGSGQPLELERVWNNALEYDKEYLQNNIGNYLEDHTGLEVNTKNKGKGVLGAFTVIDKDQQKLQDQFFADIIFIKRDDCYYDVSTGGEYTSGSINVTYGHVFQRGGNALLNFSKSQHKQEVEVGMYRPELYEEGKAPIFEWEGLKYLNIYRPSPIEPLDPGNSAETMNELQMFLDLINKHYPDKEYREHKLDTYSHIYQKPGVKIRSAIINWSPKFQIGKNLVFDIATGGLGNNASVINPTNAISPQKAFLYDKQLILVDELKIKGDWENKISVVNAMKPMITNDKHDVRPMYKPNRTILSSTSFEFNTNHKDAITLQPDEERYSIFKIEQDRESMGGSDFFRPIDDAMRRKDPTIFAVVKHYLLNRKISENFEARGTCVKTPWLLEMAEATAHTMEGEIKIMMDEKTYPFDQSVISISSAWKVLKKENNVKGNLNVFKDLLVKLGSVSLGECFHKHSKRKVSLYIIRNHDFFKGKDKSPIATKYWLPDPELKIPEQGGTWSNEVKKWKMSDYHVLDTISGLKEIEAYEDMFGEENNETIL